MPRQKSIVTIIRDLVRTEIQKALGGLFGGLHVGAASAKPKPKNGRRRRRRKSTTGSEGHDARRDATPAWRAAQGRLVRGLKPVARRRHASAVSRSPRGAAG